MRHRVIGDLIDYVKGMLVKARGGELGYVELVEALGVEGVHELFVCQLESQLVDFWRISKGRC